MISSNLVKVLAFILNTETSSKIIEEKAELTTGGLLDLVEKAIQSSFLMVLSSEWSKSRGKQRFEEVWRTYVIVTQESGKINGLEE